MEKTRECAMQWVNDGKPCTYRHGFAWKGAKQKPITVERAKELISEKDWDFQNGPCSRELNWERYEGQDVLNFTQYGMNDMW